MIRNYFLLAWRNLKKNRIFSLINILGLSVGLTCCLLIGFYLHYEFNFDTHHRNGDRVYQLGTVFVRVGGADSENSNANSPAPMARMMQDVFPEIEKSARIMRLFADDKTLMQYKRPDGEMVSFYETKGFLADSSFFDLLTYSFLEGNPANALVEPLSIVLREDIARKLFANESAINQVIRISSNTNGDRDFKVTGVFRPGASPSHIDARFFLSMRGGEIEEYVARQSGLASNNMFHTYFLLREGSSAAALEAKFPSFIKTYAAADLKAMGFDKRQFLTRLKDVHLHSRAKDNVSAPGNTTYLYILASIALFTLLIACINFMNLATARSARRASEVGVRKVLGAQKRSLILQFLGESLLMAVCACVLAFVMAFLALPLFSRLSGIELALSWATHGYIFIAFFALSVFAGLLAGIYPALYLSAFQPIKVLKGRIQNSLAAVSFRKFLVVFQFFISVVLIIASVVINNQMRYMRNKDLGFVKDQQILLPLRSETAKSIYQPLKTELQAMPGIRSVGASSYYPGIINPSDMVLYREGTSMDQSKRVVMNYVDEGFLNTLGIEPVAGRLFSPEFPADTANRMVINEMAARELGFANASEAANQQLFIDWRGETIRFEVVGVVKDFHFQDLHSEIKPYGFQMVGQNSYNYLVAHVSGADLSNVLSGIESAWNQLNPAEPFEYNFLDESFEANYAADERLSLMVYYFTIIAIFISCMGLFGLATFSAEQRTREIGIRKVLGASVSGIVSLLSKDFLRLVIIAVVIGSPVAAWVMHRWLNDFAYRTNIEWTVFLVTALIAVIIALLTISVQAIRAALANPVKSLRES